MSRVVVTGMGIACPLGTDLETVATAQREGRSGAGPLSDAFDATHFPVRAACRVPDWSLERLGELAEPLDGCGDRKAEFGVYAAREALRQAFGDDAEQEIRSLGPRAALHTASGLVSSLPAEGEADVLACLRDGTFDHAASVEALARDNRLRWRHYTDRVNHLLAWRYGFGGPALVNHGACAAGAVAIGTAARWVRHGWADVAVAGGFESMIHPFGVLSFQMLGALSERDDCPLDQISRPFDRTRDGFVIGEGAGMVVLESEERARARGAQILGVVHGLGTSLDSHRTTAPPPDGRGAVVAMRAALAEAGLAPGDVDWINAHGTGTPLNDSAETAAIETVFGGRGTAPPVTSSKSAIGHAVAAAGAVEAVLSFLALRDGVMPPTLNLREPDPECGLDYVADGPRAVEMKTVVSNSFGFGGVNGSLVLGRGA